MCPLIPTAYTGEAAKSYDAKRFVRKQDQLFAKLELEQFERSLRRVPIGGRVLESGCGTGRFSEFAAGRGYNVLATDPSSTMIELASRRCQHLSNIAFSQEEGADLKSADSIFDFVFAIRVTNQVESVEYALKMVKEMIRVTKKGGLVLVEFVNDKRPWAKKSKSVKLSFQLMAKVAFEQNCAVERRAGVLVFSQTVLGKMPKGLLSLWTAVERAAARLLWRWASRGYVLLRKK